MIHTPDDLMDVYGPRIAEALAKLGQQAEPERWMVYIEEHSREQDGKREYDVGIHVVALPGVIRQLREHIGEQPAFAEAVAILEEPLPSGGIWLMFVPWLLDGSFCPRLKSLVNVEAARELRARARRCCPNRR